MSIVQLSRFLSFFSSDSFDILSNLFSFVKNFFIFLFCPLNSLSECFKRQPVYVITSARRCQQLFFKLFFDVLSCPIPGQVFPSFQRFRLLSPALLLPGRSASASPAELIPGGFKFPSSATGAILSLLEGIVNVFLVFYLFQTIHTIQYFLTILKVQNMALPIIVFIHTLNACRTEKNTTGSSPKRSIRYNRN